MGNDYEQEIQWHETPPSRGLPSVSKDDALLEELGYKPELKRNFSVIQVFGIAFSIMSLLPSIASVLVYSLPAGPAGMTWGWLTASCFILTIGLSMAEMGSAMPTSGGLYWWTFKFSPPSIRRPLCFLAGYANTLGLIGGLVSIDYGFAELLLSVPAIATDGAFSPNKYQTYGVFAACIACHAIAGSLANKLVSKIQTFCIVTNLLVIVITVIALPIGKARTDGGVNSGEYVFTHIENHYQWPIGFTFFLSWLAPIWTIGAFDSCVHMAEEASNASVAVPVGIISSITACGILGFMIQAIIAACMDKDIDAIMNTYTGQPMAAIYLSCLGKGWTIALMCCLSIIQFQMGFSIEIAASRQIWAFSRDGALMFSNWLKFIHPKLQIPLHAIWFAAGVGLLIGCLSLIDEAATSAIFSLVVASNTLAWILPIMMRTLFNVDTFKPGPFYMGKTLSKIIGAIASIYGLFAICILAMFPLSGPNVTKDTMNYTCLINGTVWGGCLVAYFVSARHWFEGPKQTYHGEDGFLEGVDVISDQASESYISKKQ